MIDHEKADIERFKQITDAMANIATKEDLKGLATEASVRDVVHWQKNIVTAGEILSTGGKFSYKTILVLATLLGALSVITGAWKVAFLWLLPK